MKQWIVKTVRYSELEKELNALAIQDCEIYSVTPFGTIDFRIIAYKTLKIDDKEVELKDKIQ